MTIFKQVFQLKLTGWKIRHSIGLCLCWGVISLFDASCLIDCAMEGSYVGAALFFLFFARFGYFSCVYGTVTLNKLERAYKINQIRTGQNKR